MSVACVEHFFIFCFDFWKDSLQFLRSIQNVIGGIYRCALKSCKRICFKIVQRISAYKQIEKSSLPSFALKVLHLLCVNCEMLRNFFTGYIYRLRTRRLPHSRLPLIEFLPVQLVFKDLALPIFSQSIDIFDKKRFVDNHALWLGGPLQYQLMEQRKTRVLFALRQLYLSNKYVLLLLDRPPAKIATCQTKSNGT